MGKDVILINPKLSKEACGEKPLLPIALLALAGPLEQNGFAVRILDEHVEPVLNSLSTLKSSPVCFGISCMLGYQVKSGLQIARTIRRLRPHVPIVWGGWFPTVLPELTVADPDVDIVVRGKGEIIFLEVVKSIAEGKPLKDVKGIIFKEKGRILETPLRPLDDPNTFAKPPYHLLDISRYCVSEGKINYASSYGCPFRCRFCAITSGLKRQWNGGLAPERVLDDLEALVETYGIKHVMFHEDNFCLDSERAKKILRGILERNLGLTWAINARADQMARFDSDLLKLLSAPAPSWINVGVESVSQRMLDFIHKDITVEQVTKIVRLAREYDIPLQINVMAGIPTETPSDYMETLRKLKSFLEIYPKLKIQIFQYGPLPGTYLYDFERQQGRVHECNTLEEWANATEDIGFSPFDYYNKLATYTNRIFRIMTFYFGCAFIYPSWVNEQFGLALRIPFKIVSLLGAFRFRFDLWALPFEWEITRFVKSMLRRFQQRSAERRHIVTDSDKDVTEGLIQVTPAQPPHETPWRTRASMAARKLPEVIERSPFVGRDSEWASLQRLLEQASNGQGSLAMVRGEAGVGKTRLCEELVTEARLRGFLALVGHCYEIRGMPPYIPFVEMVESAIRLRKPSSLLWALGDSAPEVAKLVPELRRFFPDIPSPAELPPEQERRYVFNAMREFIARVAEAQPLLLVLEDLQWADEPSLLLVLHIAKELHEIPILVVGTYRDAELGETIALAKAVEELLRQRLTHELPLKRLERENVMSMLRTRTSQEPPPQVVDLIYGETDGNPFFVEEVFKHLAEEGKLFDTKGQWYQEIEIGEDEVPPSIRLVIERRLERVSPDCRHALAAAAVIGHGFSFELLKELVNLNEDALLDVIDTAERTQLISAKGKGKEAHFTFFHDLIRQTLVSDLSPPRRQRLHLRIAGAMERVYARSLEEYAAEVAHHLYQAGLAADPQKTVRYFNVAGDRALGAAAFEEALRLFDNALSLVPADDVRAYAELLGKRGLALRSLGRLDEALAEWQRASVVYEKLGDAEKLGRICVELSQQLFRLPRWKEAYEVASRGLAALGNRVNPARCHLLATAAEVLTFTQAAGYSTANEMLTEALDVAEKLGEKQLLGPILYRKAWFHVAYWQGQKAADVGMRAEELLRSAGHLYEIPAALNSALWGLIWMGRFDEAMRVAAETDSLAERAGNDFSRWFAAINQLMAQVAATADLDQYEKGFAANVEFGRNLGIGWIAFSYTHLGMAQFWRGDWQKARENLRKGEESELPGMLNGYSAGPLFLFTAYDGDKDAAIRVLKEKNRVFPRGGQPNTSGAWTMLESAIEGFAMLEQWDEAARLYPLALEAVATGNLLRPSRVGLIQTVAGISALAGRQWDDAEKHFQTALRQAHGLPFRIEQPEVRRWYARMLMERNAPGDKEKARTLLTEATSMYRQIGMPRHLEVAKNLIGKL